MRLSQMKTREAIFCFLFLHLMNFKNRNLISSTKLELYRGIISQFFFHDTHDPIADWMDSSFSRSPNVSIFCTLSICNYEYMLPMKFLLNMLNSFCISLNSCKQEFHSINQVLSWLHYKFDYI